MCKHSGAADYTLLLFTCQPWIVAVANSINLHHEHVNISTTVTFKHCADKFWKCSYNMHMPQCVSWLFSTSSAISMCHFYQCSQTPGNPQGWPPQEVTDSLAELTMHMFCSETLCIYSLYSGLRLHSALWSVRHQVLSHPLPTVNWEQKICFVCLTGLQLKWWGLCGRICIMSVYHLKRVIALGLCNCLSQKYIEMSVFNSCYFVRQGHRVHSYLILWKDGTWKIKDYQYKIWKESTCKKTYTSFIYNKNRHILNNSIKSK